MLETLREDFARLPEILALGPPEQPAPFVEPVPEIEAEVEPDVEAVDDAPADEAANAVQLDLFAS